MLKFEGQDIQGSFEYARSFISALISTTSKVAEFFHSQINTENPLFSTKKEVIEKQENIRQACSLLGGIHKKIIESAYACSNKSFKI